MLGRKAKEGRGKARGGVGNLLFIKSGLKEASCSKCCYLNFTNRGLFHLHFSFILPFEMSFGNGNDQTIFMIDFLV